MPDGSLLTVGQHGNEYFAYPEQHRTLCEWVISFYWSHTKEPMTGFKFYGNKSTFEIFIKCTVVWWHPDNAKVVSVKPDGGEYLDAPRYLLPLEPGVYHLREFANGIIFARSSTTECHEHQNALELEGIPIPASLRVTGFDKS